MAKANLAFTRIGNDGYEYARRAEDGAWFLREGYYGSYGWTRTKWKQVNTNNPDDMTLIEVGLKAHSEGLTSCVVGFTGQMVVTDGKGLRLP
ncbi:hypothetical protein REC_195 [Pseudomonas phage REC]|nr:hypothetical protein REC_195 [Pseudomonas phage REC]UGL62598.1 hypothetical protein [Pseudomonas phage REC1]